MTPTITRVAYQIYDIAKQLRLSSVKFETPILTFETNKHDR